MQTNLQCPSTNLEVDADGVFVVISQPKQQALQDRSLPTPGMEASHPEHAPDIGFEVMVGLPSVVSFVGSELPMLLIDADLERIVETRTHLEQAEHGRQVQWREAVIGAPEKGEVEWFRFNDERLDGPWHQDFWQRYFVNAQVTGCSQRLPVSLAVLLEEWNDPRFLTGLQRGALTIRQGNPMDVIASCELWLDRFECIRVQLPVREAVASTELDAWLVPRGYLRHPRLDLQWKRHPLKAAEYVLVRSRQRCEDFEDLLAESAVRRLLAEESIKDLKSQLAEFEQRNQCLLAENEALQTECAQRGSRINDLTQLVQQVKNHVLQANTRLAQSETVKEELAQRNENLQLERHEVIAQKEQLLQIYHQLTIEHHRLADRYAQQRAELEEIRQLRNELAYHYQLMAVERANLNILHHERQKELAHLKTVCLQKDNQISVLSAASDLLIEERDKMFLTLCEQSEEASPDLAVESIEDVRPSIRQLFLSGRNHSSDKWESYLSLYEKLLSPYLGKEVRLLEVGVQNGGSLECWADYLGPNAVVIGVDINPCCGLIEFKTPRIRCYVGDATSRNWLEEVVKKHGPFDIIIDDGSHMQEDIISAFQILCPHLAKGGVYVVEDLHCSYFTSHGGGKPGSSPTAMNYFQALTDMLNYEHWAERGAISVEMMLPVIGEVEANQLLMKSFLQLESIEFHNSLVALRRRPYGINNLGTRIVSSGEARISKEPSSLRGSRLLRT